MTDVAASRREDSVLAWPMAISAGLAVPAFAFGNAVGAVFVGIAFLICLGLLTQPDFQRHASRILSRDLMIGALVTTALFLLSSLLSEHPQKAATTTLRSTAVFIAGLLLCAYFSARPSVLDRSLKVFLGALTTVLAYICLAVYFWPEVLMPFEALRGGEIEAARYFKGYASAAACAIPVALWAGFRLQGVWKGIALAATTLGLLAIYNGGGNTSDSGVFGLIGGAAFTLLVIAIGFRRWSPASAWTIGLAVFASALGLAVWYLSQLPAPPIPEGMEPVFPFPDWHRQIIWGFTLQVIEAHPVFGVGPNTVNMVAGAKVMIPGLGQEYIPSHPHNWVLEVTVETGIIGLAALLITLLIGLRHLVLGEIRSLSGSRCAIALFGTFWVSALANFSIWSMWWLSGFAFLMALPLSAMLADSMTREGREKNGRIAA